MPKIGVVLAGGASKGTYEIGCLRAIEERFGIDSIKYVCSSSIGSVIGQTFGLGRSEDLLNEWKTVSTKEHGRFILAHSGNETVLDGVKRLVSNGKRLPFEHYVSVWNYTKKKVEYIPFHELSEESLVKYMRGAVAIPFFSKGEVVGGDLILDGSFLDNIPAYPLLNKEVDYIFCIYFDNCKYVFENERFDSKIIKLFDFPNDKRLEILTFHPERFDDMVEYGYRYAVDTISKIFDGKGSQTEVYEAIAEREKSQSAVYKPRMTADVVLNNINVMTKRFSKRLTNRNKQK